MTKNRTQETLQEELGVLVVKLGEWVSSDEGQRLRRESFEVTRQTLEHLNKARRVNLQSLNEPVTL